MKDYDSEQPSSLVANFPKQSPCNGSGWYIVVSRLIQTEATNLGSCQGLLLDTIKYHASLAV